MNRMAVSTKLMGARISFKHSQQVCRSISGKKVTRAKAFLNNMLVGKESLDGKYFSRSSEAILEALETAEANARQKNLNLERLFVKVAKADKGEKFVRPRSRFKQRGKQAKVTNLTIMLEER